MVFRTGEWAFGAKLETIYTKACFFFFFFFFLFFFTFLFGDFRLVRDSQNPSDKESFFSVFCNFFYTSKYLRVMELCDTKFMVRGRPLGSCRWSNLWLVLALHGVEPALTALFQRSGH